VGEQTYVAKRYANPSAFRAALTQAARNMSKKTGMSVPDLMKIFWFNRLAARVFTTDPDGWLIKGGQALLVRYRGRARLSQDIDLQCTHPERSAEEARDLVVKAAALDLGDYLRYVPGKFEEHRVKAVVARSTSRFSWVRGWSPPSRSISSSAVS
jgi:hypothetical protein